MSTQAVDMSRAQSYNTVTEAPSMPLRSPLPKASAVVPSRDKPCPGCGVPCFSTTGCCWNCDDAATERNGIPNRMANGIEGVSDRPRTLAESPDVSTTKVRSYRFSESDPIYANIAKYIGQPRDAKEMAQLRRISALVAARLISEASVYDAAMGVRECRPEKPFGYFMASVRENVAKKQGLQLSDIWHAPIQMTR